MVTRTVRDKRSVKGSVPSGTVPKEIRERIQSFHGEKNLDAVRDEALLLAGKLEFTEQQVQELSVYHQALREKVDALTAHEHYAVVITGVEQNCSWVAEVAGLGNARVEVSVHPDVDPEKLVVGAIGFVGRERNCLLKVTAAAGHWQDVGTFEEYLGSPGRILLRERETLVAVDVAHQLRDTTLQKGDQVGFDRNVTGMAYERLPASKRDHLFDEQVTDDFSLLGGFEKQIKRIKRHIDFRFRYPELAKKYRLKSKCGILLKGAPGNGKTRIARCCAGYARQLYPDRPCRFMHIAGSSDYSMWFGETERKLIERFDAVREAAQEGLVVMFWDEVDAIAKRRGTDYGNGAPDRITNTLLSQIDGVKPLTNVVMLFATNRSDTLDPGLLRAGQTHDIIDIPPPNRRATAAILRCYIDGGLPLATKHDELIEPLVSRLFAPNGGYAEVAQVKLNDGRRLSVAGRELISGAMLESAVEIAGQEAAVREADTMQEGLTEEDLAMALETELVETVSLLAPGNVKSYVSSIPQDAQPIAVDSVLTMPTSTYVRTR